MRIVLVCLITILVAVTAAAESRSSCFSEVALGGYRISIKVEPDRANSFENPCEGVIPQGRVTTEGEGDSQVLHERYQSLLTFCDTEAHRVKGCVQFQLSGLMGDGVSSTISDSELNQLQSRAYSKIENRRVKCRNLITRQYRSVRGKLCSDMGQRRVDIAPQRPRPTRKPGKSVRRAPEPVDPNWLVAKNKPCKVFTGDPKTTAVTWTGGCVNGKADGYGTARFSHPDPRGQGTYTGTMRNGKKHGRGKYTWPRAAGKVLSEYGQFRNGVKHGTVTVIYLNGDRFTGAYMNGRPHGTGTMTFAKGYRLWSEWRNGVLIRNKPIK